MQISESQRRFTVELDGVVRYHSSTLDDPSLRFSDDAPFFQLQWFSVDVIQQMDSNTRQDRNFIQVGVGRAGGDGGQRCRGA